MTFTESAVTNMSFKEEDVNLKMTAQELYYEDLVKEDEEEEDDNPGR